MALFQTHHFAISVTEMLYTSMFKIVVHCAALQSDDGDDDNNNNNKVKIVPMLN
jgi:hypothetical protein